MEKHREIAAKSFKSVKECQFLSVDLISINLNLGQGEAVHPHAFTAIDALFPILTADQDRKPSATELLFLVPGLKTYSQPH